LWSIFNTSSGFYELNPKRLSIHRSQ